MGGNLGSCANMVSTHPIKIAFTYVKGATVQRLSMGWKIRRCIIYSSSLYHSSFPKTMSQVMRVCITLPTL